MIDRYEAARALDTLEWAVLCAERDRGKGGPRSSVHKRQWPRAAADVGMTPGDR